MDETMLTAFIFILIAIIGILIAARPHASHFTNKASRKQYNGRGWRSDTF